MGGRGSSHQTKPIISYLNSQQIRDFHHETILRVKQKLTSTDQRTFTLTPLQGHAKQATYISRRLTQVIQDEGYQVLPGTSGHAFARTIYGSKKTYIRTGLSPNQAVETKTHELVHILEHHLAPQNMKRTLRWQRELDASAVTNLVLHHYGINTGQFNVNYLSHWVRIGATPAGEHVRLRYVESNTSRYLKLAQNIVQKIGNPAA